MAETLRPCHVCGESKFEWDSEMERHWCEACGEYQSGKPIHPQRLAADAPTPADGEAVRVAATEVIRLYNARLVSTKLDAAMTKLEAALATQPPAAVGPTETCGECGHPFYPSHISGACSASVMDGELNDYPCECKGFKRKAPAPDADLLERVEAKLKAMQKAVDIAAPALEQAVRWNESDTDGEKDDAEALRRVLMFATLRQRKGA